MHLNKKKKKKEKKSIKQTRLDSYFKLTLGFFTSIKLEEDYLLIQKWNYLKDPS